MTSLSCDNSFVGSVKKMVAKSSTCKNKVWPLVLNQHHFMLGCDGGIAILVKPLKQHYMQSHAISNILQCDIAISHHNI